MKKTLVLSLFLILLIFTLSAQQQRVALVIGNSAYQNLSRLRNPANDAEDVSNLLKTLGFEVITLLDADLDSISEGIFNFSNLIYHNRM